jgi:hypothetical protein
MPSPAAEHSLLDEESRDWFQRYYIHEVDDRIPLQLLVRRVAENGLPAPDLKMFSAIKCNRFDGATAIIKMCEWIKTEVQELHGGDRHCRSAVRQALFCARAILGDGDESVLGLGEGMQKFVIATLLQHVAAVYHEVVKAGLAILPACGGVEGIVPDGQPSFGQFPLERLQQPSKLSAEEPTDDDATRRAAALSLKHTVPPKDARSKRSTSDNDRTPRPHAGLQVDPGPVIQPKGSGLERREGGSAFFGSEGPLPGISPDPVTVRSPQQRLSSVEMNIEYADGYVQFGHGKQRLMKRRDRGLPDGGR